MVQFSKRLLIQKLVSCVSPLPVVLRHNKQFFLSDFSSNTLRAHYFSTLFDERKLRESLSNNSIVVSYLTDSCGLSPEKAKSASQMVKFETPERPDSVLELFRNYGFDKTHISAIVRKKPRLLLADPEKTLLPKLEFFLSIGLPKYDLTKLIAHNPSLLARSLENQIVPYYEILKRVLGDDNKVVKVFKCSRWLVCAKSFEPNIAVLRQLEVTATNVELLLNSHPSVFMQDHKRFLETIDQVKEMRFDPLKSTFVLAVQVLSMKKKELIWNRCFETYTKWGWSEDDILSAFKKHPYCMTLSRKKIERTMDFFVNKMGYQSKVISEKPAMLFFSFEKRIIPRCSVIQVLTSKGLIKNLSLCSVLSPVEKLFLKRFVTRYEVQLPSLMSVYQGKIDILAA